MREKVIAFGLTFVSYALIHAVRTSWAYVKPYLQQQPIGFDKKFLGILDMVCLLSLAVSLRMFGWIGDRIGYKLFLIIGMCCLTLTFLCTSLLLLYEVKSAFVYIMMLSLVGIFTCAGWPSCLSIMSIYFPARDNSFLISLWNGCSQFGDLVALVAGYLVISKAKYPPQGIMLVVSLLMIVVIVTNWALLKGTQNKGVITYQPLQAQRKQRSTPQKNAIQGAETNARINVTLDVQPNNLPLNNPHEDQVNFLNIWLLPSVTSYVLCFGCLKSVNSVLMNWLVAYLYEIGLKSYLSSLTIVWSISSFIGSLLMGYFNNTVNRIGLIVPLLITSLIFIMLAEQARQISIYTFFLMIIISGLCFGGPYGMVGTQVALSLANQPSIKLLKGAMGKIISLMEGFGQLSAAVSMIVVPLIGLDRYFYIPFLMSSLSAAVLIYQHVKQKNKLQDNEMERRERELKEEQKSVTQSTSVG